MDFTEVADFFIASPRPNRLRTDDTHRQAEMTGVWRVGQRAG